MSEAERFRIREVRIAVLIISGLLMVYGLGTILSFPRL